jgi:magnesium transporter
MQLFVYDASDYTEYDDFEISDFKTGINVKKTNWLNLHGLNEMEIIDRRLFKIDNFLLSDILNTSRRTKVEEFPGTLFFNIKSLLPTEFSDNISVEQISFDKGGVLISFQEKEVISLRIRERIRIQSSIVRSKKPILLYLL